MFKYSSGAPSEVRSAPLRTCPLRNTTPHRAQARLLTAKPKLEAKVRSVRRADRLLFPPHACLQVTIHFLSHSSLPLTRAAHYCEQKDDGKSCGAYDGGDGPSDLALDPGLRLALLVTYAFMAVLQATRIRLPLLPVHHAD